MRGMPNIVVRYAAAAWTRRWPALAVTWVVCLAGWVYVSTIPNQYQSSARVYIDADAVLTPLLRGLAIDSSTSNDVDILQRTLLSRPNLAKLISKTDLDVRATTIEERERLMQQLATSIRIQPQTRSLFNIDFTDTDPKLARDVVQTIITLFVESATGNSRGDMENARQFLQRQIASYEDKLRLAERQRADFQRKFGDVLPAAGGGSRLEIARGQVQSLQGQVTDTTARRNLLKQELTTTPPLLVTETAGSGGRSSAIANAERELAQLRLRFTDQHPDVIAARGMLSSIRASPPPESNQGMPPSQNRSVPNPVFEQLKVRIVDAESQLASLQRQVAEATQDTTRLEKIVHEAPGVQADYTNMNRDYDVLRKNYEELLARRESMRIGAAADSEADKVKLRIVDPPQISEVPVSPKRRLLIAGVLGAGIAAGLAVAFLLVQLDSAFYTVQDLRAIGLPVMGGISLREEGPNRMRNLGVAAFAVSFVMLVVVFGGVAMHPLWLSRFV